MLNTEACSNSQPRAGILGPSTIKREGSLAFFSCYMTANAMEIGRFTLLLPWEVIGRCRVGRIQDSVNVRD